jgi:hypothetical protein
VASFFQSLGNVASRPLSHMWHFKRMYWPTSELVMATVSSEWMRLAASKSNRVSQRG